MKTYNIKTNHSDFSLLACFATQICNVDPERCAHYIAAKEHQTDNFSTVYFKLHFHLLTVLSIKSSGHLHYCVNTTCQQELADQTPLLAATEQYLNTKQ